MSVDFTIAVDTFRPLVERVKRVVEKRNTVPILSNVCVTAAKDGQLTLTGTDLDIWATAATPGIHVHSPGAVTVPATLLFDILRKASGDMRFCDTGEGRVTLQSGRAKFSLNALPVEDFPDMAASEASARFDLAPQTLTRIAACCSFAISTEETRYYLNGIYLHPAEGGDALVAVATDGHRLSRVAIERPGVPPFAGIIIPRKMVGLFDLVASVCKGGEAVRIAVDASRIVFETAALVLASKLIDGTYPDYQRVIPAGHPITADVPRESLADAIERVTTITAERGRGVSFAFSRDALRLSIADPGQGSAEDEVACGFNHDDMTIGFNGRYARDALATFPGERMLLALADPGSPAVLTDPGDESRLVVLMPMRVA
ncbi:MAG TPA: DNA polymerase III subunit beta [Roseovarius sp.]|nr:DNA polymerase III subunit beta [Roseovarius sp.]